MDTPAEQTNPVPSAPSHRSQATDEKTSTHIHVVPDPDLLARYSAVNPDLPAVVLKARGHELAREFWYAMLSLTYGIVAFLSIVIGFIYLVMQAHAHAAAGLLATGVLGLIGGFIRSRLRNEQNTR